MIPFRIPVVNDTTTALESPVAPSHCVSLTQADARSQRPTHSGRYGAPVPCSGHRLTDAMASPHGVDIVVQGLLQDGPLPVISRLITPLIKGPSPQLPSYKVFIGALTLFITSRGPLCI